MSEKHSIPVEHQDVPQAHQGLHQFLYSSDQEHEVVNPLIQSNHIDTGDLFMALNAWQNKFNESKTKIAAVYAIAKPSDQVSTILFIGIARDLGSEIELLKNNFIQSHIPESEQNLLQIKVQSFKFPKKQQMTELCDRWLSEISYIPIGNQTGSEWNIAKSDKDDSNRTSGIRSEETEATNGNGDRYRNPSTRRLEWIDCESN
jgi:hypothetical protein